MPPLFALSPSPFTRSRAPYDNDAAPSSPPPSAGGAPPPPPPPAPSSPTARSPPLSGPSRRRTLPVKLTLPRLSLPHSGSHHSLSFSSARSARRETPPAPPAVLPAAGGRAGPSSSQRVGLASLTVMGGARNDCGQILSRAKRAAHSHPHGGDFGPATAARATLQSPTGTPHVPPAERELLVLVHGLQGAVGDFSYLLSTLRATRAHRAGRLVLHATSVNTDRTHDGIAAGAQRLALDIRSRIADAQRDGKPVHRISLLGFSLGGIYVRYAVALLFDAMTGTVAGLRPASVILVASPHLGVRKFGYYRFVPDAFMAAPVFGDTVRELMLADDDRLLLRMTQDADGATTDVESDTDTAGDYGSASGSERDETDTNNNNDRTAWRRRDSRHRLPFLQALQAFEERILYANVRNDFMVNYGTAALDANVTAVSGEEVDRVVRERAASAVDEEYDDKGCRICFRFWMDAQNGGARQDPAPTPGTTTTATGRLLEPRPHDGQEQLVAMPRRRRTIASPGDRERFGGWRLDWDGLGGSGDGGGERWHAAAAAAEEQEEVMARRLRKVGWWVVGVDFPLPIPIAHNRIVAMSRNLIHSLMNAPGRRVVHHLVDVVGQRFEEHEMLFRTTMGVRGIAGVGGVVSGDAVTSA